MTMTDRRRIPVVKRVLRFSAEGVPNQVDARCQALLNQEAVAFRRKWKSKRRGGHITTCGCFAKYMINGFYFCRKHAALYVLDELDPVFP